MEIYPLRTKQICVIFTLAHQLPGCQTSFSTQTNQQLHFPDIRSSSISQGGVATGNGVLTSCLEVRSSPEPETDRAGSARPAV